MLHTSTTLLWGVVLASTLMSVQLSAVAGQSAAAQSAHKTSSSQDENLASLTAAASSAAAGRTLSICIITADFWGVLNSPPDSGRGVRATLKGGGGTATAYHLLASLLKQQPGLKVTFLGVTKDINVCTQAQKVLFCLAH